MADRLTSPPPTTYLSLPEDLKARILTARLRAVAAANRELVTLYFDIGVADWETRLVESPGRRSATVGKRMRAALPDVHAHRLLTGEDAGAI